MTTEWPTDPDDHVDPALEPLIEAGQGEAEGFEQADAALIDHASHGDQHGTGPIVRDGIDEAEDAGSEYAEADEEEPRDL
jgi:hypothetical protein